MIPNDRQAEVKVDALESVVEDPDDFFPGQASKAELNVPYF